MSVVLLLQQALGQSLLHPSHRLQLSSDQTVHRVNVPTDLVQTLIDWSDSMKFVFISAVDAVGTKELLLGLAVNRDAAVVL